MGRIHTFVFVAVFALCLGPASAQNIITETIPAETVTDWSDPSFWETVDGEPASPPLLGYAMGRMNVAPPVFQNQHVGELLEIFLLPEARGLGLGQALVAVITEALRGRGAQVLRAAVPVANEVARSQLQHAGYKPLQRILERQLDAG